MEASKNICLSKPKTRPEVKPQVAKPAGRPVAPVTPAAKGNSLFSLDNAGIWLAVIAMLLYLPSLSFQFTELDDSIFIREFNNYYENPDTNLFTAFTRGLFNPTNDPYYRPIFLDVMFINHKLNGEDIFGYHLFNILLHGATVFLLFRLFSKMGIEKMQAALLTLLFAVHPVLTQAVAWVPGRNDTMLAIFSISFFIACINYSDSGTPKSLVTAILMLLLAFFTKETALFTAPAAFVILVIFLQRPWNGKRQLTLYGAWLCCFAVWFLARYAATTHVTTSLSTAQQVADFFQRLPVILHYLGKIFLPFNLSVLPIVQDTVIYFGLAALAGLIALLALSDKVNWRHVIGGLLFFMLFLLPALLVPRNLNEQTFEHRLYLPIMGILMLLPETALFKRTNAKTAMSVIVGISALFAVLTFVHQRNFASPRAFWQQAVSTSPHSAFANMMLAARMGEDSLQASYRLFRRAYQLNPNEKYLNYYYGKMLQMQDSIAASEKYLLKEKNTSGFYECDFYLARVAILKNDTLGSIAYLENYLKVDRANPPANNNLLLMLMATRQFAKAKQQVASMKTVGLPVPAAIEQQVAGY
ncbi:MAG: hypothetical protein EBZ77_06830 [Chitinophagia bacterium]|nr:hypothetical protein [Chitinophagia bacterium]